MAPNCTNTEKDLQLVMETFTEVCGWFRIQIAVKKTEVMMQRPLSNPTLQDPSITKKMVHNCQFAHLLNISEI